MQQPPWRRPAALFALTAALLGACSEAEPAQPSPSGASDLSAAQGAQPFNSPTSSEAPPTEELAAPGLDAPLTPLGEVEWIEEELEEGDRRIRRQVRRDGPGFVNHGLYERFWSNGEIQAEGQYRDGVPEGLHVLRFQSGYARTETPYQTGKIHGEQRHFYQVGSLKRTEAFVQGRQHGIAKEYFIDGQPMLEETWKKGKQTGPYTAWFDDGSVSEQGEFKNGKATGYWRTYYQAKPTEDLEQPGAGAEHILSSQGRYIRGRRDGFWEIMHPNGKPAEERNYEVGKLHGQQTYYDLEGNQTLVEEYAHGTAHGKRTEWNPGGGRKSERNFVEGVMQGLATDWFESGDIWSQGEMKAGQREGFWKFFNQNGTPNAAWTGTYENGQRIGD